MNRTTPTFTLRLSTGACVSSEPPKARYAEFLSLDELEARSSTPVAAPMGSWLVRFDLSL